MVFIIFVAMRTLLDTASSCFKGAVRLLVVDDNPQVLYALNDLFSAVSVFSVTALNRYADAHAAIRPGAAPWHCRIFDLDLGEGCSGLDLIRAGSPYPFVIVLSGMQSMSAAAEAINQGALKVFDKNPDCMSGLFEEACRVAALGYVLGGGHSQYLPAFQLLASSIIHTPEEWAKKACVTVRQLHRICRLHPLQTPRTTLALYYSIHTLLRTGHKPDPVAQIASLTPLDAAYLRECLLFAVQWRETAVI